MAQDSTQDAWDRIADAKVALHAAMQEYANALYDHNVRNRLITPLGAYRDAADTLETILDNQLSDVRYALQMRVHE